MKNDHASNGIAEELIRSFIQFGAAELHAKTLVEKSEAELENGLIDVEDSDTLAKQLEKVQMYTDDVETYAELRRRTMLKLFDMFEGDKDEWCVVKHLGLSMMTMFESYEASNGDTDLYNLWLDSNKAFIKAISRFLGTEITECAACISDALKAKE